MGLVPCYMVFYFLSPTKFLTIWYFSTSLWKYFLLCLHDHLGSYNKSQLKTTSQICIMCCIVLNILLVFFRFLIIMYLNSWFFENCVIFFFFNIQNVDMTCINQKPKPKVCCYMGVKWFVPFLVLVMERRYMMGHTKIQWKINGQNHHRRCT